MTPHDDNGDPDDLYEPEEDDDAQTRLSDDGHHLLHVFRDLVFSGDVDRLDDVASAITSELHAPWRRATERDKTEFNVGMEWRVFGRETDGRLPGCLLFLTPNSRLNHLYVSNIVPTEGHSLGMDIYNAILAEFTEEFAAPAANKLGIQCQLSDDWADFANSLGESAFKALRAASAFKPGTHPNDRQRWMSFIVTAHRADLDLDTDLLRRWFVADGFSPDRAWQLMTEFDFATELLKLNDQL